MNFLFHNWKNHSKVKKQLKIDIYISKYVKLFAYVNKKTQAIDCKSKNIYIEYPN